MNSSQGHEARRPHLRFPSFTISNEKNFVDIGPEVAHIINASVQVTKELNGSDEVSETTTSAVEFLNSSSVANIFIQPSLAAENGTNQWNLTGGESPG